MLHNRPPITAHRSPNNEWMIDGRAIHPVDRHRDLNRGPGILKSVAFITLHESALVTVEREMADDLHDYIVFNTTDQADRIVVERLPEPDLLSIVINTERFIVILAGFNQFVVFNTQGGNDLIHVSDEVNRPILINAGPGDDRIWAGSGYSRIFAGPGNDTILNRRGTSYIEAGDGNDQVIALDNGDMTVYAGPGNDTVIAHTGQAFIHGGDDDDHLVGGSAHAILVGGPGNDTLQAGTGTNTLYTGDGLDVVRQLKPEDNVFANPYSGLSAAGQTIAHGMTPVDDTATCPHPQARVTDISARPLEYSGIRVIGNAQFQRRVNDDLQLLACSPKGQKLFEALRAAEERSATAINIFELEDETNGIFVPRNATNPASYIQNNQPGTPTYGGAVYYNPTYMSNQTTNIPLLYHELCHAYNAVTGSMLSGESEDGEDASKPRELIDNHELQAVGLPTNAPPFDFDNDPQTPPTNTNPPQFTENGIREELGLPLRKQYVRHVI